MYRMIWGLCLALCAVSCSEPGTQTDHVQLILDWKAQMEHAGFFVAKDKGYYKAEGIDIDILEGSGAPTAARVVGNGTYKLGVASGSATVMARAKGIPVVSIAVINQHTPVVIYSLQEKGIKTPQDLVGKRIGVNIGGTKHREFQAFLKKVGIPENAVQLVGLNEASPAPLLAGQVDAMLGYTEDEPVTVELKGHTVNRIPLSNYGIDVYSTNIIANEAFLKKNPDLIHRFMRATIKGWKEAIAHPDEAVTIYMKSRPESNAAFNHADFKELQPLLQSPGVEEMGFGAQTEQRWTHTQDVLFDLGMVDKKLPVNTLYTNAFLPAPK